jgi:allose kinase
LKYFICLELGGTNLRYGIVDKDLKVVEFNKIPTQGLSDAEDKIEYLRILLDSLIQKVGHENVSAITMALASLMDKNRTVIYSSPMVKNFNNIPIVEKLEQIYHLPVIIEKDVNILLLYEIHRLQYVNEGITVGVFIGTGLGNAICIDGKVYKGSSGTACELGHIPVPGLEIMCGCGKKGCIELLASGNVLYQLAKGKYGCHVSRIFTEHGDEPDVRSVVHNCAIAIATEVTILDPACLILGGGVTEMQDFPFDYLEKGIRENLRIPNPRDSLRIVLASGHEEAGVVGAALHAKQLQSK